MTDDQFAKLIEVLTRQAEAWEKAAASVATIAAALQTGVASAGGLPPPNSPVIASGPKAGG